MARSKNLEKRNEILKIAYRMFCEKGYEHVFIREIADEAGISKALVQHYFAKKSDILEVMLEEILEVSFRYINDIVTEQESIYLRLSVYTNLFFEVSTLQQDLRQFIQNIIADKTLLKLWVNIIYRWLGTLKNEELAHVPEKDFQIALTFAMAGGTELLLHQGEWELPVSYIAEQMVTSFMRILNNSPEDILQIILQTANILRTVNLEEFSLYCKQQIFWYE
ncbi:TetR/AcrR family transcriptional regulator [Paenibacillus pedocola]|uniref:TetR/AcrR family transcriptional regulator n=1 Tax=Paenibacillus pedocola TaxID=3242193 RepID=UPI0028778439|nr:TetR/AcrR family transcriptional regulator [Paenibacillus typhae]